MFVFAQVDFSSAVTCQVGRQTVQPLWGVDWTRAAGLVWVQRSQGTGWRRAGVPEPEGDGSPGQAGRIQALLLVVNWRLQSGETSVWLHPVINNIEY